MSSPDHHHPEADGGEYATLTLRRIRDPHGKTVALDFATGLTAAALSIVARERGADAVHTLADVAIESAATHRACASVTMLDIRCPAAA
jgi:hypothetical protein